MGRWSARAFARRGDQVSPGSDEHGVAAETASAAGPGGAGHPARPVPPVAPVEPAAPIRHVVTVRCAPEHAFMVFTERMGAWWPLESYSRAVNEFAGDAVSVTWLEYQARPGGAILEHLSDG